MTEWSNNWKLKFHPSKCKTMRMGNESDQSAYYLDNHPLDQIDSEKDLGITVDNKLKFEDHVNNIVNKANKMMGLVRRSFDYLDKPMFTKLFKSLVRPHLEYASTTWFPTTVKMKNLVENVQRRATKRVNGMREMEYEERLRSLNLPCLLYRKIRGDMIETYKMCNNMYDEGLPLPIKPSTNTLTSRSTHRLTKTKFNKNVRKYFFKNRIVNLWNRLPNAVKDSQTTNTFKNRLDDLWKNLDIMYNFTKCMDFTEQHMNLDYAGSVEINY